MVAIVITDNDRKGIARALAESAKSTFGRVKIGAAVMDSTGWICGYGHNQRRTHPRQYEANKRVGKQITHPCIHAEIDALLVAQSDPSIVLGFHKLATIYVARLDRNGRLANCRPCAACHSEIVRAGIKRVVFTTENGVEEYKVNASG